MEVQGIEIEPSGSRSGIAARDIMWAVGICAVALGLTPVLAVYVLLIA
ncbi:MAG: hypothetical protein JSS22_23350 [Proteobacteria bacterium]|nr:hypothetical protein [Pseudomonadota bacterium]